MSDKIRVAFDLDGVIIDKPPLIPKKLLEYLFRGNTDPNHLHYRYPKTKLEILIRKLSHFYLFRPPIKQNIKLLKGLANKPKYELYVVSARYSFIEKETYLWLKKRGIYPYFKEIRLNLNNEQPHIYKEKVMNEIRPKLFIDDDEKLVEFLKKNTNVPVYCYHRGCDDVAKLFIDNN